MTLTGNLLKMQVKHTSPVEYALPVGEELVPLNPLLGNKLHLHFENEINCIHCGRKTSKSFQQGFCYPCMQTLAQCDMCILKPELCHYHKGTCREPEWGQQNCMIDHFVYLALSSGVKVGITRHTQVPTRWIDQGAVKALPIARVHSRYDSGRVEHALRDFFHDKTHWQAMLKNVVPEIDLVEEKQQVLADLKKIIADFDGTVIEDEKVYEFEYPVLEYPTKVKSLSFDKQTDVAGTLMGIKGQYLILDTGVINIRKHNGYKVRLRT